MARVFLLCLFLSFKIHQCLSLDCAVGEMYENDCYLLITTPVTWQDAKQDCMNRNGSLASITNDGTNNFIANVAGGGRIDAWIGATDEENEGEWKWSNGDKFEFTSWASGQPTNRYNGLYQNCMQTNFQPFTLGSGKWADDFCLTKNPYICQGRKLVPDHTEPIQACNGEKWWKEKWYNHKMAGHGYPSICNGYPNRFTSGDNKAEKEIFIQSYEYNSTCANTCKTLHPTSTGITESVRQTYKVNGWSVNKCWCEFGTPVLNRDNKNYQTCMFEDEPLCFPVDQDHLDACTKYTNLTEAWRRIDNSTTKKAIHCDSEFPVERWDDPLWKERDAYRWYRFTGAAGSKLPEGPSIEYNFKGGQTGTRNCGSSHLAYIKSMDEPKCEYTKSCHPSLRDGVVKEYICFESAATEVNMYAPCEGNFDGEIHVAACKNGDDEYFVYKIYFFIEIFKEKGCFSYCAEE